MVCWETWAAARARRSSSQAACGSTEWSAWSWLRSSAREARRNLAKAGPCLLARRTEGVTADVLEWRVPDELTLLFLYCPFMGDVFHRTLEAVFASHDRAPRRDGEVIRVSHP